MDNCTDTTTEVAQTRASVRPRGSALDDALRGELVAPVPSTAVIARPQAERRGVTSKPLHCDVFQGT